MLHYVFLLNFLNKLNTLHTPHKESSDSLQKLNCKLFIYLFPLFFFPRHESVCWTISSSSLCITASVLPDGVILRYL